MNDCLTITTPRSVAEIQRDLKRTQVAIDKANDKAMRLHAELAAAYAHGLQKRAAEHGLKPGGEVIRLSGNRPDGSYYESLYRYDTASYWAEEGWKSGGWTNFKRDRVIWDGVTSVSLDNGD